MSFSLLLLLLLFVWYMSFLFVKMLLPFILGYIKDDDVHEGIL